MSAKEVSACCPMEIQSVSKANNQLAVSLYSLLAQEKGNMFFSPFSISTAMAMLFCGAERQTSAEMRSVLGYDAAEIKDGDLRSFFQLLLIELGKNSKFYTLACANSIVTQKSFPIKEEFKSDLEKTFQALLREVDFGKESQKAVLEINEWVKSKTGDMIPQLLGTLDPSTVMVLLNAIYFKGLWLHPFEEYATYKQNFYNHGDENKAKEIDMMHMKKSLPFAEKEDFKCLQLPYKGGDIAMLILLPRSNEGLGELERKLSPSFISNLKNNMDSKKVDVSLPKFNLDYSKSLKKTFQSLGMKLAFTPGADFGQICDSSDLFVSDIIHKAVLEVNETGTKAAAATAIMACGCCLQTVPDPQFIVDHPFAFAILDTRSDLIIFLGRVNEL